MERRPNPTNTSGSVCVPPDLQENGEGIVQKTGFIDLLLAKAIATSNAYFPTFQTALSVNLKWVCIQTRRLTRTSDRQTPYIYRPIV